MEKEVTVMHAFVATDPEDGREGVIAASLGGMMMPLVAADQARIDSLMPVAKDIAKASKAKVSLLRFSTRETVIDDIRKK